MATVHLLHGMYKYFYLSVTIFISKESLKGLLSIHVLYGYIESNGFMKTVYISTFIIFAKIPMKEQLDVIDYRGYEVGKVNVSHASFLILMHVLVHMYTLRKPLFHNLSKTNYFIEINMKKN